MPSVFISRATFAYASLPILESVDLELHSGWTGVVGPNGAGKSTLLGLIAGTLEADEGAVRRQPASLTCEVCAQRVEDEPGAVRAFAARDDAPARRWIGLLRLDPDALVRWETLSPGERKRWQVGAALAADPHVLLLDEPTNHLDGDAVELLVNALAQFRGIGIVVAHDRRFLDALTTHTILVRGGTATSWTGGYSSARGTWERSERELRTERERVRDEARRVKKRLGDKRRARAQAEGQISAKKRMKGPRDHDGRSMAAKGRVQAGERGLSRDVEVARGELERAESKLAGLTVRKELGKALLLDFEPAPKQRIASLDVPALHAGSACLLRDVRVELGREDHVHLAGPNGSGKSTVIGALLDNLHVPRSQLLYLPQEIGEEGAGELLRDVRELPADVRGRTLTILASLGVEPDAVLRSERLSPGEARKLALARGMGCRAWGMILDEPTNHLDLPSIEALERALTAYPGALLLVTHDADLARACTGIRWGLEDGHVRVRTSA
ncbi:MAG: ABC-F family ATP-binding cassette domain-containing protein [bacterium]|nr:ABC-F family ATP-binding cassette domain-containing protein [bacterium]